MCIRDSSNLSAAQHATIKLRILGYQLVEGKSGSTVSLEQVGLEQKAMLGIIEHNRWMSERLMMGWSFGPRSQQPPQRPSICDKSLLSAEELAKDYEQVDAVFKYWLSKDYHLERIE